MEKSNNLAAIPLEGLWELQPVETFGQPYPEAGWHQQVLPAHWQAIAELESHTGRVVYRRRFSFHPDEAATPRQRWLRLHGVFYRFAVYLNGHLLGRSEGYFFPHEFAITDHLQTENELIIEVESPIERSKLNKETLTGVFAHWDALSSYKYNAGGLWLPIEVVYHPDVHIERALLHTEAFDEQAAHVALRLDLAVSAPGKARWCVTFTPHNFEGSAHEVAGEVELAAGHYGWQQRLSVPEAKLWWTHDLGMPHLYRMEVRLDGPIDHPVTWRGLVGFRTWEMRDYVAYLNGQRLYIKGSNYPPSDARLATMNAERAAEDMRLAVEAHMNMLRIHAHVDHPAVYAAADEAGVLLWQDFPMQWLYAKSVLPEALRQSQEMVRLLYNHPSVVIWCLHNEPLYVEDTSVEPLLRQLRTYFSLIRSWNRDVMDTQLAKAAQHLDPQRTVIRSSGEMWIPFRHSGTDGHYYFGWYMSYGPKRWFDLWRRLFKRNLRFVTEFGAQSFPNYENARRFLPDDLTGSDWKFLNQHYLLQWDLMSLWFDTRSHDLRDLVTRSQAYQAEIHRYYIDRLRFYKYKPNGGFLNFMFHDSQPAVTWSLIDYWRTTKASYDAYRLALSPQYVFCLTPKDQYRQDRTYQLPVYVINDAHAPHTVQIEVAIVDPSGTVMAATTQTRTLPPDCEAESLGNTRFKPDRTGTWHLRLTLNQDGHEAIINDYELAVV